MTLRRLQFIVNMVTAALVTVAGGLLVSRHIHTFDPTTVKLPDFSSIRSSLPKGFIILSGSMEPAIPVGSAVITLPQDAYAPGDVVTFYPEGNKKTATTHRISGYVQSGTYYDYSFETRGDANKTNDFTAVKPEHIVGKVFLTYPYLGYAANAAKTQKGFIFLIIVPATIVIYEELKFLMGTVKKSVSGINRATRLMMILPAAAGITYLLSTSSYAFFASKKAAPATLATMDNWGQPPDPTPTLIPTPEVIPESTGSATPAGY